MSLFERIRLSPYEKIQKDAGVRICKGLPRRARERYSAWSWPEILEPALLPDRDLRLLRKRLSPLPGCLMKKPRRPLTPLRSSLTPGWLHKSLPCATCCNRAERRSSAKLTVQRLFHRDAYACGLVHRERTRALPRG